MLNPRAYRAALLEQLTSAADTSPEPVQAAFSDAPTSSLRLRPVPSTETPGACVVEDDVVLKGRANRQESRRRSADSYTAPPTDAQQQQQDPQFLYTIGHGYAVERESNRSLILSFIDNCIRAGVPEEAIAEQVQFMVSSMKESLALHAALHAQRHKERIREYELGALTNMVERQQLQLEEQQHQPHQAVAMSSVGYDYAPLQLAPPPPLVYAGQTPPLHTHEVTEHAHARAPPQRQAPSPPPPTPAESSPSDFASPVPISVWHRSSVASSKQQQQPPSVQLSPLARQAGAAEAEGDGKSLSRSASGERPTARPAKQNRRVSRTSTTAATATRTHALHHRDHEKQHRHHRSHHALCAVCLRNAQDDEAAAGAGSKRNALLSTPTARRTGGVARATQQQQQQQAQCLSPSTSRQRYTPNGHYMKPTHASLVRRASSTSPLRHNAASNPSPVQLRRRSSPQQRRLVVRSTYSSRLRATASRPPPPSVEGSTGVGSTAGADDSESSRGSRSASFRANRSSSYSSRSSSVASTSTDDRVERRSKMQLTHPARRETRRGDAAQNTRAASLDLYTSDTPPRVSLRPRVTHAAQTDGWTTSRTTAAPPPPLPSSHNARLSIDPEPASTISAAETPPRATEHVGVDAGSGSMPGQWRERRPAPEPPAPVAQHHEDAIVKGGDQQRQGESQRPNRNAPCPNAAPGNATSVSSPPPPTHAVTTVVVMDQNDDDDAGSPVCVTSPQLQYFIEASQRKVRETDRLLGGTSHSTTAPSVTWHQHQVQRAPRSADVPVAHHVRTPPAKRSDWKVTSSVLSSPYVASSKTLWSDSSGSAAREKQLRRLRELRDRLRDYDTPAADGGAAGTAAVRPGGETTFASAWTSPSASAALSPDVRFRPHLMAAAAASQDKSPLIEISPTSSDEDNSRI